MQKPELPKDETDRQEALDSYQVLDTLPEKDFDDLVLLASTICQSPIALISLIDSDRQWFKAKVGLNADQTARDISFCGHAILEQQVFVVPNATTDPRFADNPLVTGDLHLNFYAGAQLKTPEGFHIGTLCVIDHKPKVLSAEQVEALSAIARQVIGQLELRKNLRALELKSQELNEAHIAAQASAQAKGDFLAVMSHEIRTPMNGIIGLTNLLQDSALNCEQREYVDGILHSGRSLMMLINDVLDFSKIEAGKLSLHCTSIFLPDCIKRGLMPLANLAKAKGLQLELKISEEIKNVWGDPLRITQILINLVGNAIKFSDQGTIRVSVEKTSSKNYHFTVEDNGIGIPVEAHCKIFDNFVQADSSTTRRYGGSGLGLSISKLLVELMGGEIGVKSQPSEGATFWFTLPLELAEKSIHKKIPSLSPSSPMRGRILLAEDNLINQKVAVAALGKLGLQVIAVSNGELAIQKWQEENFDLIFMDGEMPELDGYEATKRIREIERNSGRSPIPIIALTANVMSGQQQRCLDLGMNALLQKPLDFVQLQETLNRWLKAPALDQGKKASSDKQSA
jgi:signal transduction histidine kinase